MPITAPVTGESIAVEEILSDVNGNGPGNGGFDGSHYDPEGRPERPVRPAGLYRAAIGIGIVWIGLFFATATIVLVDTRLNVSRWNFIPLPRLLYLSTVLLLFSSWTMQLARSWSGTAAVHNCTRWMRATLLLGAGFIGSQVAAWMNVVARGNHRGSQTPIFFFYLFTGTHAVCVLAGVVALGALIFAVRRWGRWRRKTALSTMALFWHFAGVLWLYTLGLLSVSVGR